MRNVTIVQALLILTAPLLLSACSSTRTINVAVPPKVDLHPYPVIGLVAFTSSNGDADLEWLSTQKFLKSVQAAQPGTRVVELGAEQEVLSATGRRAWDAAALRSVKEAHGVDVLVIGRLDVEKIKPQVKLSTVWKSVSARSDVNVSLSARLIETRSGATMWTDSAGATTTVAHGGLDSHGRGGFGASDPEAVYGEMIGNLAYQITDDFRVHYVTRRVPRNAPEYASTND